MQNKTSSLDKIDLDHFEKIFCYKMVTDEEYFSTIVDVTDPEYFKDKHKKAIFLLIKEYFEQRDTIPNLSELKTYLTTRELKESFKSILLEIQGLDKVYNKEELMKNTERFLKERAVYKTILEVADSLQTGDVDTSWLLDKFEKTCNINLTTNIGLDLLNDIDTLIDDINTDQPVIPCGWKWLNNKLDGGFLKNGRALYIFAGQTNVGKSIVLGNVATSMVNQGKTVLLITLEMSEMMYARRLSSSITKIPIKDLRSESQTLRHSLLEIKSEIKGGRLLIKEFPPSTVTPNQIGAFIKSLRNKGIIPDAVVLDYVNLLHTKQGSNSYERIKIICEQVRALSYQTCCPFISATQLNRCLEVSTLVSMQDDSVKRIDELKVGDVLVGSEGPVEVRYVYPKERKGVYKITTESGKTVTCSDTHMFPVLINDEVVYKSILDGMTINDELIVR